MCIPTSDKSRTFRGAEKAEETAERSVNEYQFGQNNSRPLGLSYLDKCRAPLGQHQDLKYQVPAANLADSGC
ncbi:hypothetical protein P7K49_027713 [Saguinus oedipus]|uniref:Uncharacterized protein n=1 Tax=Saguinus oedipus TaxID=9490 RepID=A0ABQ9UB58_SAGOE|nr:hypothetical protein P7K49_027713 [Saguinus oedipus]